MKGLKSAEQCLFGPEEFAAQTGVSRETLARLKAYADMLADWNARHNLVAKSTLPDLWQRHFWDSAQLAPLIPENAKTLADLGSGAGFPGPGAGGDAAGPGRDPARSHHQEMRIPAGRRRAHGPARHHRKRADGGSAATALRRGDGPGLRPPAPLLEYAHSFTGPNSVCLFLKGQNVGSELTEAHKYWNMKASQVPSQTDPSGAIVTVRELGPRHVTPQKTARPGRRQPKRRRR